ncbi:SDR family NAD(P)-dependent oxidoreductase [Methylovirgula sp. 4M-Z18]|uniref:SDR family NAD(P)-dependent oxidoreductase n=1 Tax=Methylovirgula sp. 4M-Z18 TaxID=2293567 RepID=UPI000E2F59D9|nr:SDR family oxidoreductase [Methylovirgula sp. 4M-Z18]RFB74955.1 SDR family oxidoreductase [Methylovirgula sp. 4M-Z18]
MELNLKNKVVIVTGASSGIGLETTKMFLAEGARVVGVSRDMSALADLGALDHWVTCDVDLRQKGAGDAVARATLEAFGRIDVLFNNAAICPTRGGFLDVSDDDWAETMNINLGGYIRMARAVLPTMIAQKKGVLIHCGSEAGRMPHPLLPDYSTSKAAITLLSKALAREFTPKGVRSNVIAPAHIRTELWDRPGGFLHALADYYGTTIEGAVDAFLVESKLPAGRLGTPRDVAMAVLYLASDLAEFISGDVISIDGGVIPTT